MRAVVSFAMLAVTAACTFPDVDYADAGTGGSGGATSSSSTSGGTCAAPSKCATDAMGCADLAQNQHKGCIQPCKMDKACIKTCDDELQSELGICAAACESCAAPSCSGRRTNCDMLVGL